MDTLIYIAIIIGYVAFMLVTIGFITAQVEDVPAHNRMPDWVVFFAGAVWPVTISIVLVMAIGVLFLELGLALGKRF